MLEPMGKLIRILAVFLLCAIGYWVHSTLDLSMDSVLKETRIRVESSGAWGPVLFIGLCIGGVLMHGPEILVVAFGGLLFPKIQAISYGWIGVILGSSLTFFLSRYLLRESIQRHVMARFPKLKSLDEQFVQNGFRTVLVLRLILFMAPPLNWALGATRVRYVHYLLGTMLGVLPGVI